MADIFCLIHLEPERATFTWSEGPASFEPYRLEGDNFKEFKEIAEEARTKLANLVKDFLHYEEDVPKDAAELADIGNELYLKMFDPIAEQRRNAREIRLWLENLRDHGDVDELEIVTDGAWAIPWNVIYDQQPKKEEFLSSSDANGHWQPFWGVRYNLSAGRKVSPLRRLPLWRKPTVLIVIDPPIRDGLPEEIQQRLQAFVETHDVTLATSVDEVTDALQAGRPDLLYWLSHATPSALCLGDDEISPRQIKKLFRSDDDDAPLGGLAFLNACQTAEAGETGSFLEAFYQVGFSGMVGTEHQTIDTFAAPRGLDFLEAFLDRGEPVGRIMHDLRRRVPLGLLYGAYCPPTLMVELESPTDGAVKLIHDESDQKKGRTLGKDAGIERQLTKLPAAPYRSLDYYTREDRALFAGRDDDVERFALLLDEAGVRIVVLHGESGVGKSSFLRAGVIPFLEEECPGYRFLRRRGDEQDADQGASDSDRESVLFIRATNDLVGQFAQTIGEFCTKPLSFVTPAGRSVEVDLPGLLGEALGGEADLGALRTAMCQDLGLLARILASISDRLPYALVMIVDQAEEMFTLAETDDDAENRRLALAMLRQAIAVSGEFKIILSLRTEYYGRVIDGLRRGLFSAGGIREYLLTDFDEEGLVQAIRLPTLDHAIPYTDEIPFEKYQFRFAEGVPEEIARRVVSFTTHRHDSVLPLVQVTCTRLHRAAIARADRQISHQDLEDLGGIEGGMKRNVEDLIDQIVQDQPSDRRAVEKLLIRLCVRQPDGSPTTALLPEDDVAEQWSGRLPFEQLLPAAQASRLLRVNTLRIGGQDERRYVSLGHDSMARVADEWIREWELTWRGRAEARLIHRAKTWSQKKSNQDLPGFAEYVNIRLLTDRTQRSKQESEMLRAAKFVHLRNASAVGAAALVALFVLAFVWSSAVANNLKTAQPSEVVERIKGWSYPTRKMVRWHLREDRKPPKVGGPGPAQLKAQLALLPDQDLATSLRDEMLQQDIDHFLMIRDGLKYHDALNADFFHDQLDAADGKKYLRAAATLADLEIYDSAADHNTLVSDWQSRGEVLAGLLVAEEPEATRLRWAEELQPWRHHLDVPLISMIENEQRSPAERSAAAGLFDYYFYSDRNLNELDEQSKQKLFARLHQQPEKPDDKKARTTANIAVALLLMGDYRNDFDSHVRRYLQLRNDPTLRTYIIDRLAVGGVSPERILDLAEHEARKEDEWTPDPEVMQALILGLGRFSQAHLPELIQSRHLREFLQGQYASNSSAAVHSAIEWLYRRAGKKLPDAKRPFKEETPGDPPTPSWSGTKNGHTMVAFRDVELLDEPDPCSFAISTTEVTVEQFLKFLETEEAMELPDNFYSSELGYNKMVDDYKKLATEESDRLPAFGVSWLLAARYCNWLSSETPHLDGDQWCYNPTATSAPQMITANSLERLGYRLPTVKEWQYACQAKSTTKYNFGDSYELLFQHATKELVSHWRKRHVINVGGNNQLRFQPVAELMPNGFGLFDVHGNIAEWCHPANPNPDDGFFPMRGGAFADKNTNFFASEKTEPQPPELDFIGFERYGFRPARTLP